MITRKEFVKSCAALCTVGFCGTARAAQSAATPPSPEACDAEQLKSAQWKSEAGQQRFAGFVAEIERDLDPAQRKRLFNGFGHQCARTFKATLIDRYQGNLKGFLEMAQGPSGWMSEAHYDEAAGTLHIVDRSSHCTCPLVKQGEGSTPPAFCDCTLGWQEEAYSTILGKPVHAELEASILRGAKHCAFRIQVLS